MIESGAGKRNVEISGSFMKRMQVFLEAFRAMGIAEGALARGNVGNSRRMRRANIAACRCSGKRGLQGPASFAGIDTARLRENARGNRLLVRHT